MLITQMDHAFIKESVPFMPSVCGETETRRVQIFEGNGLVHSLIELQASTLPDNIALQFEDGNSMTFREMNETANAVARGLRIAPGSIVPILTQQSLALVVAVLAVLKSGAAYVILSPYAPNERNAYMINDVRASVVIIDKTIDSTELGASTVYIEDLISNAQHMTGDSRANLNIHQSPSECAYIVYSSGTTGKPKGAIISHSAAFYGLSELKRAATPVPFRQLLCHAPCFSAAQRSILGTLVRGGTLCLASKDSLVLHLHSTIVDMGITSLEITPSMLKLIDPADVPSSVRQITLGGETVSPELLDRWGDRVEVLSAYGLSECTQLNMRQRLKPHQNSRLVGKPSDTTHAHILSPGTKTPLPPKVPGELCLSGPQLADGYLNLPEKTAEVFVENPFCSEHRCRLYRTGDMAMKHEDGAIEIIGRIDQQVKIDGQRVEPSESNAIISKCQGVIASSVVSAVVNGRKALAAIVVAEESQPWQLLTRTIRGELQKKLSSYAIPTYWISRQELPLNVNGKVDVAALVKEVEEMDHDQHVKPSSIPQKADSLFSSPSGSRTSSPGKAGKANAAGPIFADITAVCAEILSLPSEAVDLDASFLELGGTSLDAIIATSKLRQRNIRVAVPDFLQASSLWELASKCSITTDAELSVPTPFSLLPEGITIKKDGLVDAYPASPLQEGILFDSIVGNANYFYRRVYKIQHSQIAEVRKAFEMVLARNDIFRTVFVARKHSFLQLVRESPLFVWEDRRETGLEDYQRNEIQRDFSLQDPLIQATVLRDDMFVVHIHHALFDFWSSQFLFVDMADILRGQAPIKRAPFSAYISLQQKKKKNPVKTKLFWKEYLETLTTPSVLDFGVPDHCTSQRSFTTPITVNLPEFCAHHGVTVGTVIHAAWALTLSTHLKTLDIIFLTAFSGRDADVEGILSLAGPTLCTVPIRIKINRSDSVLDFATAVRDNLWVLSSYAHSGLRNAIADGGLNANSFNTMVNILAGKRAFEEDGPLVPVVPYEDNFTQYPTIEIDEANPTHVKLLSSSPISSDSAQSLLKLFTDIIVGMVCKTQGSVDHLLSTLNQKHHSQVSQKSDFGLVHHGLEKIAAMNPSKVAICTSSGVALTYEEFNTKANSFANFLISQGVKLGEMIPLYMEKSSTTLIAIFGILKAGAAFAPLDPRNPYDRNAFIIQDLQASRLITDETNLQAAKAFGVSTILPDLLDLEIGGKELPIVNGISAENAAYAIYTSGSTGLPKGVLVQHSAVCASTEGMIEATAVNADWNALWVLNYVFDASYYDVFTMFTAGASLCLAPQDELLQDLAGHINRMGIRQVMLTPTITKLIRGGHAQVPGLKALLVCGEKIDMNILDWAKLIDVYNGYGPTEATILMTVSKVKPEEDLNSIGQPLKHVTAKILPLEGDGFDCVSHGQVGELCVRGPHLAKGYINRPEQTAAAFIQDEDGEPLYRTGDLAKWNSDGSLTCLGRKDYQIKLNGFRIELGEIENAILQTNLVDATVVSVCEIHGKRQLVAMCIFRGDHDPNADGPLSPAGRLDQVSQLMKLLTTISHYMMPALFLSFGKFPTLPSGKTNRKELVRIVETMGKQDIMSYIPADEDTAEFVPITTEEEIIMQQAWAEVLGEPDDIIHASSSFLSLGGDSISAINLVAVCRKLSYTISVANILSNATLAEQARFLKPTQEKKVLKQKIIYDTPKSLLAAIKIAGLGKDHIEHVLPAGPGQAEFLTQGHKRHQFWNLTTCRDLPADFDLKLWIETTKRMTAMNEILRTAYFREEASDASCWLQVVLKDPPLNYTHVKYDTEEEKQQCILQLRDFVFSLSTPAIKYLLLESSETGSRTLCIKVDHGSYDGTLLRIFDDQFTAIAQGKTPPPVNSFKKYIDWVSESDKNKTLKYWTNQLESYKSIDKLPPKPIANSLKFANSRINVDDLATKFGVTASTVFQAVYSVVIGLMQGTTDTLVNNLITGRNADVENPQQLNGTCANFLPFRLQLVGGDLENGSIAELFKRTQSLFWETTENGNVGLHDIYKTLGKDRISNAAKLLYCFQPFTPAPTTTTQNHMRWLVMAQSKVFMVVNYAVMLEVQKTSTGGYRFKVQYDSRALREEQASAFTQLLDDVLEVVGTREDATVKDVLSMGGELRGIWR